MKAVKEDQSIDAVAETGDLIQVEVQNQIGGTMLYVHANGRTVLRIGRIPKGGLSVTMPVKEAKVVYPDLAKLRDGFSNAIAGLPNYKRTDAWSYIAALEAVIQRKEKEIEQTYESAYRGGLHDAHLKPGDGMMGG